MKLLNHPDTEKLLARFQEIAGQEFPAKVLFENRTVDCANGLKDDFKQFEVHVYELLP